MVIPKYTKRFPLIVVGNEPPADINVLWLDVTDIVNGNSNKAVLRYNLNGAWDGVVDSDLNDLTNRVDSLESAVEAIKQFSYEVVTVLPLPSEDTMYKIYIIKQNDDKCKEYITIKTGVDPDYVYSWEELGYLSFDIDNYYTKTEVNDLLAFECGSGNNSAQLKSGVRAVGNGSVATGLGIIIESQFRITGAANTTTYTTDVAHNLTVGSVVGFRVNLPTRTISKVVSVPNATTFVVDRTLSDIGFNNVKISILAGVAYGTASSVMGYGVIASGESSHAEGDSTVASGDYSHAEGNGTIAAGNYSHVEGEATIDPDTTREDRQCGFAEGYASHAEGTSAANGAYSHAEGYQTHAMGGNSHAEGNSTDASGVNSHTEGRITKARGGCSHAEGQNTQADGAQSHAEGWSTQASGNNSHSEGKDTIASGNNAHAEGLETTASGNYSHAEGYYTEATNQAEHAEGKYNKSNTGTRHSVGIGTSVSNRKNAHEITNDGKHYVFGVGGYDGTNPGATGVKDLASLLNDKEVFVATSNSTWEEVSDAIEAGKCVYFVPEGEPYIYQLSMYDSEGGTANFVSYDYDTNSIRIAVLSSDDSWGFDTEALQEKLTSGTNIKTINSTSLLGSGNIAVQPTLVSGSNIKTVNSTSLLGSGNVAVQPTLVSGSNIKTINSTSLLGSGNIAVQAPLTFDNTPTKGSNNPVKSDGIAKYSPESLKIETKLNEIFTFQKTNVDWDAKLAELQAIKGVSVVWNQLADKSLYSSFATTTVNGIEISLVDGVLNLNGTAEETAEIAIINVNAITWGNFTGGHKVIFRGGISNKITLQTMAYTSSSTFAGDIIEGNVRTLPATTATLKGLKGTVTAGTVFNNEKIYPQIFDLTAGNMADWTFAQFNTFFPLKVYPFTSLPVIKNNCATALETTGLNQWDEEWELGTLDLSTGAKIAASGRIRSKNFIPIPGGSWICYRAAATYGSRLCVYDANENFIVSYEPNLTLAGTTLHLPDSAAYILFSPAATYGTSYANDICVSISGARNGQYEPYRKTIVPLGITTMTGKLNGAGASVVISPDGLAGVGGVFDRGIVEQGLWKATEKKMGKVNLGALTADGTLTWVKQTAGSTTVFYCSNIDGKAWGNNILCSAYSRRDSVWSNVNKSICSGSDSFSGQKVYIIDDSHSTAPTSEDNWLAGVELYFELATPLTYVLDNPVPVVSPVDEQGTMLITPQGVDLSGVPQTAPFKADISYTNGTVNSVISLQKQVNTLKSTVDTIESLLPIVLYGEYDWDGGTNTYTTQDMTDDELFDAFASCRVIICFDAVYENREMIIEYDDQGGTGLHTKHWIVRGRNN